MREAAEFGVLLERHAVGALTLTSRSYDANSDLPMHSHERPYVSLVTRGGYTERTREATRLCSRATVIYHPAGEEHSDRFHQAGARCFDIAIGASESRAAALPDRTLHTAGGSAAALTWRIYREFQTADDLSPLAIEGLTLELIATLGRAARPASPAQVVPPAWLQRARDYAHDRFDQPFSLASAAREIGVHPVHLARTFRQHHRRTMGEYVRELRIDFASRQLAASDDAIADIALAAGFADQSHFARTFKRLVGMSPARYRAAHHRR